MRHARLRLIAAALLTARLSRFAPRRLAILRGALLVLAVTAHVHVEFLDANVLLGKPLVSGAAQGFEGQLTVYWAPKPGWRASPPLGHLAAYQIAAFQRMSGDAVSFTGRVDQSDRGMPP